MDTNRFGRLTWMAAKLGLLALVLGVAVYRLAFAPVAVEVHRVSRGTVTAEVAGTGTLEARVKTAVSSKIQGRIVEMKADQGERVKAGQLLAVLDDSELKWQVAMAGATLEAARATSERTRSDEARAKAVLEQAQLDFDRTASLRSSGAVAQADADKSREGLKVAEADLKRAAAAIVEAGRQEAALEHALGYHQALRENTRILSPFDGVVVARDREAGDVVVPGGAILQVVSTEDLWVSAWVDESAIAAVAPGQPARIVFRSEPGRECAGTVARVGRQVDRDTREFLVDVRVSELPGQWAVGQRAEVYVATGRREDVLTVPFRMVAWREGRPGVFLNRGGRARWQAVKLGMKGLDAAEVAEGLAEGDALVAGKAAGPQAGEIDGRRLRLP